MSDTDNSDDVQTPDYMRRIRSFVLREGRMTPAQQHAFEAHWSRYGIDYSAVPHDFRASFGREAPIVLEIGFGNGEALAGPANTIRRAISSASKCTAPASAG